MWPRCKVYSCFPLNVSIKICLIKENVWEHKTTLQIVSRSDHYKRWSDSDRWRSRGCQLSLGAPRSQGCSRFELFLKLSSQLNGLADLETVIQIALTNSSPTELWRHGRKYPPPLCFGLLWPDY
jgi:hypothetical protein